MIDQPAPAARVLPIWKRALYSLIVLVSLSMAVEAIMRAGDFDRRLFAKAFEDPYEEAKDGWWRLIMYDPVLYWRGRPFARLPGTDEFLNARGFRGTNFDDEKPAQLQRIVCMGDSATFGLVNHGGKDFRYTPTYSSELQRLLNTDDVMQTVQVINAGVIGYATAQGLRLLKHEVRYWQPDVVTIRYGVNDHLRRSYDYRPAVEPRTALLRWSEDSLLDLRTVQLLLRVRDAGMFAASGTQPRDYAGDAPLAKAVEVRVPLADFEYNLHRMVSIAQTSGAKVVLMTAPLAPLAPEITSDVVTLKILGFASYEDLLDMHRRYETVVRTVATDMDVALLDSSNDLAARGLEKFFTRYDLAHPSGEGHAAIAQDLAALLRARQWIR